MRRNAKGHISYCNTGVGGLAKVRASRERESTERGRDAITIPTVSEHLFSFAWPRVRAYGHSFAFVILPCLISGKRQAICPFLHLLLLPTASSLYYLLSDYLFHLIAHKSLLGSLFVCAFICPFYNCNLARHLTLSLCTRCSPFFPVSFAERKYALPLCFVPTVLM